ncbi:MAG: haloacid dehalogenase [Firmicutes bacterium]|nr:haloacid dehalogenase [Bacillota bacterium]
MRIEIPHRQPLTLTHVVFDLNGTLTVDGELIPGVWEGFAAVRQRYQCWLVSADTLGRAEHWASMLQVPLTVAATGEDKADFVKTLEGGVAAVGNGCNDVAMFSCANLGIAVVGPEGASAELLRHADVVMPSITEVFNFLLNPKRMVSTLRP